MSAAADDDVAILRAWQAGDRAAGRKLVERHFAAVYRFFATKIPAEADDLTQKTFSDVNRALGHAPDTRIDNFRAFAMTVARNNLYDLLRSRAARARVFDPEAFSILHMAPPASPSQVVGQRREERLLLEALRRIPLDAQVTIELYYWEDLPVKDIGDILGIPPGTVMSRLARARDKLRHVVAELTEDPELLHSTMTNLELWARRVRDSLAE